ncbi:MAG: PEGA domain-containing protein [Planctomycetota bacterium]
MRNRWNTLVVILALGCGEPTTVSETAQQGALTIEAIPTGDVLVDGKSVGPSPIKEFAVDAGDRAVTVRREGFVDWTQTVSVTSGANKSVTAALIAADPTDPAALLALAESLGLEAVEREEEETFRGGKSTKSILPLYPRGDLRVADMDNFRIDVTEEFTPNGKLEFRIGTEVLHSAPFDPESFATVDGIPDAVLTKAKPGKTVTWGYYPTKGKPVTTKFKVRKEDRQLDKRIEKLEKRMAGQPPLLQAQMRAQLLLNKRLYYAAYRNARSVVERAQAAPESLAIMQAALRRMDLKGTALWSEIEDKVERLPSRYRLRPSTR